MISVAICTRNRERFLERAVASLEDQTLDRAAWEVLVVDNASSDDTGLVVRRAIERGLRARHILEESVGLSHARNRAVHEAGGEYVAFTDDDCLLPPEWLSVAAGIVAELRPAVFGGPYGPWYDPPRPAWFKDEYVDFTLGDEPRVLRGDGFLGGANIFFRRNLVLETGLFDPRLGMRGESIAYGEESALQHELLTRVPNEIHYYDPRLAVRHHVRPDKMRLGWQLRAAFAKGRDVYLSDPDRDLGGATRGSIAGAIVKTCGALCVDLLASAVRDRNRYPYFRQYLCESTARYLRRLGRLSTQYGEAG